MKLVVGLGNPGRKYEDTRHNAGFWWVDALARRCSANMRHESRFHGEAGKAGGDAWLLKPDTYMNESGRAVGAMATFYRIDPDDLIVVHDELDLAPGVARLKFGGGLGGHNGLRSIASVLGTQNFWRLRLGIGHPRDSDTPQQDVADFVLHPPRADERKLIEDAMVPALELWPLMAAGDMQRAMLKLHTPPPAAKADGAPRTKAD